jgi:hypothetical protein
MNRIIFLSLVLALLALPAAGHETSLSVSPSQVQAGDRIEVKGAGLGENATITLTLEGVLNTYPLGEVLGNAHGEFHAEVVIPAELKPGGYTLKAQAGDIAASAPLKVVKRAAPMANEEKPEAALPEQEPGDPEHGGEGRAEEHASLEPLQLDRAWSPSETATIWGLIVIAAFVGSLLWFKN